MLRHSLSVSQQAEATPVVASVPSLRLSAHLARMQHQEKLTKRMIRQAQTRLGGEETTLARLEK